MRQSFALAPLALLLLGGPALAGVIDNPSVERVSPEAVVVRWTDGDPVDVFVADKPDATPAMGRLVSPKDKDGKHQLAAPATTHGYVILRDTRSGQAVTVAERVLPLAQGSNFRDLGGYPAAGGKHVRWGMIYRSGATPLLTEGDVGEVRSLGLANMIDLRSSEERVVAPSRISGVPYTAIGYSMSTMMPTDPAKAPATPTMGRIYREFPTFLAPHLRLVFAKLLSAEGPLVYNCSAGQDRTGFVTAMVLSALGAPRDVIVADYHLSTTWRRPEYEMPKINIAAYPDNPVAAMYARGQQNPEVAKPRPLKSADGAAYLDQAFAAIEERWGSVDNYLEKEIGLDQAEIAQLRATYLQ